MMKRLVMYFTVSAEIEQQQQEHQQKQQRMFSLNSRLNSDLVRIICVTFTARRYASAVYAVVVCLSVCVCVCVSVTRRNCIKKRLNIESRKQCHTIAQGL